MCKSIESIRGIKTVVDMLENRRRSLEDYLIKLDGSQQDILHMMENTKMNACKGYELAKAIQDIRQSRRDVKNELEILRSVSPKLKTIEPIINSATTLADGINKKSNKLKKNKIYNNRIINTNNDIRIEISNLISNI